MLNRFSVALLISTLLHIPFPALADAKNRVEELFLWKMSEELKLPPAQEKAFTDLVKEMNHKKKESNDHIQETLKSMQEAKSKKEKEKLITVYRQQIKNYNDLAIQEIDRVRKILGPEKTSEYLMLKNDLSTRVKSLLANPEKGSLEKQLEKQKTSPKLIVE